MRTAINISGIISVQEEKRRVLFFITSCVVGDASIIAPPNKAVGKEI